MKKIISYILIVLTIGQIFAPFSFGLNKNKVVGNFAEAEENCEIVDVVIPESPNKHDSETKEDKRPQNIQITVKTANCLNKENITLSVYIYENDTIKDELVLEGHLKEAFNSNDIAFNYIPGEAYCENGSCEIYYQIRLIEDGKEIDSYTNNDTGFYCTSKDKNGNDFCANGEIDDGNGNKPLKRWSWPEEGVSPVAEFWFFKANYSDGTSFIYSPFDTEMLCNEKRDLVNKSISEGTVLDQCEFKQNEQIISSVVYYFEILKDGKVDRESDTFDTLEQCNNEKKSFDETQTEFTTSECKQKEINQTVGGIDHGGEVEDMSTLPACSVIPMRLGGCIAQGIYYLFFKTSSFLFAQTGIILDVSVHYSIDNDSYESTFVTEGWGIVRDFCNMFFIFVLLYIAFGTILGLQGVKTKEMIVNLILIGLFINFSLFVTQVIIDASNILTRVFYNQNTIVTGTTNGDGQINSELGEFGEIKLSEAIVNKVDPQKLILAASTVEKIPIRGSAPNEGAETMDTSQGKISVGTFILVTLLAVAVNVVGIVVFLSSALIFISRVIGLWLAMILAPLAFFSYIVPSMKSFKMIGWSHWWPETLKLAFLAPVFVFFMYLIIGFLDKGLGIVDAATRSGAGRSGIGFVVSIVLPFIFIMILLMKAKDLAKDMSGQIGQTLSKVGEKAGGMVVGAGLAVATGGAAMAMRGTLGRAGAALQNSGTLKDAEAKGGIKGWGAKQLRNIGGASAKSSFDARATKIGSSAIAGMGSALGTKITAGKPQVGGYEKSFNDKVTAKQKRAEELQVGRGEPLQKALNKTEDDLQKLLSENKSTLDDLDKNIEKARENLRDAKSSNDQAGIAKYSEHLKVYKEQKNAFLNGGLFNSSIINDQGVREQITADYTSLKNKGLTIKQLEDKVKQDKKNITEENRKRRWNYAASRERLGGEANREAAHRIRMESKLDSGEKGK